MSRDLPRRPHIDHLKKQAKALLRSLRAKNGAATLADAQFALAREYGFASWPKLKSHIEALPPDAAGHVIDDSQADRGSGGGGDRDGGAPGALPGGPPLRGSLFDRTTPVTRQALFFARYEAATAQRIRIAPEHVLLGVIRAASGLTARVLMESGVTLERARAAIVESPTAPDMPGESLQIPFQSVTRGLFTAAAAEADHLRHGNIATIHLVMALLQQEGRAASFLLAQGMSLDAVRTAARDAPPEELT